jgi:outer membrane immunogenic protein
MLPIRARENLIKEQPFVPTCGTKVTDSRPLPGYKQAMGNKGVALMKRFLLASVALTALAASSAMAADLGRPVYKGAPPPPPPPLLWSWTGCYIGVHAGGLWVDKTVHDREPTSLDFGLSDGSHESSGWLAGGQVGCDYQFAGGFVVGIAGDYAWADAEGNHVSLLDPAYTHYSKVKSLASVTGRIGFAWDRFLGYVKGGGAWERDEFWVTDGFDILTASGTRSGWTVGIGAEYAFTNFLTGFVEYNYYDFGDKDHTFLSNQNYTYVLGIDETKSVLKAGLNLRFGGWGKAPVIARY